MFHHFKQMILMRHTQACETSATCSFQNAGFRLACLYN